MQKPINRLPGEAHAHPENDNARGQAGAEGTTKQQDGFDYSALPSVLVLMPDGRYAAPRLSRRRNLCAMLDSLLAIDDGGGCDASELDFPEFLAVVINWYWDRRDANQRRAEFERFKYRVLGGGK